MAAAASAIQLLVIINIINSLRFCVILCSSVTISSSSCASKDIAFDVSARCPSILTPSTLRLSMGLQHEEFGCDNVSTSLRVMVPWKVGFEQFVNFSPEACRLDGFSVQVFLQALTYMHHPRPPPSLHFVLYGSGAENTAMAYDNMIDMLASKEVDVVVADLTITRERMEKVGFTVPYMPSSLVMVTPCRYGSAGMLQDFLKPFSSYLWILSLFCFVATSGVALYLVEDRTEGCNFDGTYAFRPIYSHIYKQASLQQHIMNAYRFISLCSFQVQQVVRTHLSRIATITLLFVMLIFNSSYTASLASLLSAQESYPTINGFQALLKDDNIAVGYKKDSFMRTYVERLNLEGHKLKGFASAGDYAQALRDPNGVGVVLDELPYAQILVQSECNLTISSVTNDGLPSFGGFGFAFRKGDPLIDQMSKMILAMAEDGTLQGLRRGWHIGDHDQRSRSRCNSIEEPLQLTGFGMLFLNVASAFITCLISRFVRTMYNVALCPDKTPKS